MNENIHSVLLGILSVTNIATLIGVIRGVAYIVSIRKDVDFQERRLTNLERSYYGKR